jgi:iron complex outermembrane receptor protein
MSKTKQIIHRLKIFGAILFFALISPLKAENPYSTNITGVVLDSETSDAIPGVVIELIESKIFATTRNDGSFLIEKLSEGKYQLKFSHIAYHEKIVELEVTAISDKSIIVNLVPKSIEISPVIVTDHYSEVSKFDEISEYTNVLKGKELQRDLGLTLAATLKNETGLAIRSMGPAPSRPVIRGLGQDRVFISEDGNKTVDLSSTSPDHAVTIEPFTIQRVEVVRGPKVLIKTPTTIGGVVNVVRDEIPQEVHQHFHIMAGGYAESVNKGYLGSLVGEIPFNPFEIRLEISGRKANNLSTPIGELENSYAENLNYSLGGSFVDDFGFAGTSFRRYELNYGIPGGFIGAHPNGVDIEMFRRQNNFETRIDVNTDFIKNIEANYSYALYRHKEFEASGRIGSEFRILNHIGFVNMNHNQLGFIDNGILGISGEIRDFDIGGYVFTPPTNSYNFSVYFFENLRKGKFSFEFGGRYNYDKVDPEIEKPDADIGPIVTRTFNTYSLSFSALYELTQRVYIGANISKSSRVPTIEELFSEGPHLAAYSYEVGNPLLQSEGGLGTEIFIYHKFEKTLFNLNFFYNNLNNYIIPRNTGEINYQTFLPIYATSGVGAVFYGAEAQFDWDFFKNFSFSTTASYTHGDFKENNEPLPQIPPLKSFIEINYTTESILFGVSSEIAAAQNRVDDFEESTPGYIIYNAYLQYVFFTGNFIHNVSLNFDNILNEEYYNHLSRIKSILPEAGRNLRLSYKVYL